jgi:hypothetical protein
MCHLDSWTMQTENQLNLLLSKEGVKLRNWYCLFSLALKPKETMSGELALINFTTQLLQLGEGEAQ